MSTMDIVPVAGIVIICYLIGLGIKISKIEDKWIPLCVGICGGILGVIGLLTGMPEFSTIHIIDAIAIGIVSGLGATGFDQTFKQLFIKKGE